MALMPKLIALAASLNCVAVDAREFGRVVDKTVEEDCFFKVSIVARNSFVRFLAPVTKLIRTNISEISNTISTENGTCRSQV